MYMYMILKHNPKLKPGGLILDHVIFKNVGVDKLENKINKKNPMALIKVRS